MLLMGKSTISRAIFNSKLLVYQRGTVESRFCGPIGRWENHHNHRRTVPTEESDLDATAEIFRADETWKKNGVMLRKTGFLTGVRHEILRLFGGNLLLSRLSTSGFTMDHGQSWTILIRSASAPVPSFRETRCLFKKEPGQQLDVGLPVSAGKSLQMSPGGYDQRHTGGLPTKTVELTDSPSLEASPKKISSQGPQQQVQKKNKREF